MNLGPLHWGLLTRSRALDTQTFVAFVSSARVQHPTYITYGHSQIANPWGEVIGEVDEKDTDLYVDIGKYNKIFQFYSMLNCFKRNI